jgi:hypothetical protein
VHNGVCCDVPDRGVPGSHGRQALKQRQQLQQNGVHQEIGMLQHGRHFGQGVLRRLVGLENVHGGVLGHFHASRQAGTKLIPQRCRQVSDGHKGADAAGPRYRIIHVNQKVLSPCGVW